MAQGNEAAAALNLTVVVDRDGRYRLVLDGPNGEQIPVAPNKRLDQFVASLLADPLVAAARNPR